jgi:hypothetical protein
MDKNKKTGALSESVLKWPDEVFLPAHHTTEVVLNMPGCTAVKEQSEEKKKDFFETCFKEVLGFHDLIVFVDNKFNRDRKIAIPIADKLTDWGT